MVWTYPLYVLGALYVAAPVIAWILFLRVAWSVVDTRGGRPAPPVPLPLWLWIGGMLMMLVALVVGHLQFNLGTGQLIKSSIGWAKGWALLALFPLVGCLRVRPELIYRAACVVCLHTLLLLPIFVGAWAAKLPQVLYVSPLKAIGGPGPEFFAMCLYEIDPGSGLPRWRLFTPWAPALGFVANIYFIFACREKHPRWRLCGIIGSVLMILMSGSRLALVALLIVSTATFFAARMTQPRMLFLGALGSTLCGLAGEMLLNLFETFVTRFKSARADSTRVREALGRIALERWQSEAPVWGHGVVERGPHLVEYMPIGSHHSWYGLLFVKGIVGLFALAVPMALGLVDLLLRTSVSALARAGFAVLLILFLYTFGENLEILAYLFWPGLVVIGLAHCEPFKERHTRHAEFGPRAAEPATLQFSRQ